MSKTRSNVSNPTKPLRLPRQALRLIAACLILCFGCSVLGHRHSMRMTDCTAPFSLGPVFLTTTTESPHSDLKMVLPAGVLADGRNRSRLKYSIATVATTTHTTSRAIVTRILPWCSAGSSLGGSPRYARRLTQEPSRAPAFQSPAGLLRRGRPRSEIRC